MSNTADISVRWAQSEDLGAIAGVLAEAATWVHGLGKPLWSLEEVHPDRLRPDVVLGRYAVAEAGGCCVGVARITEDDPKTWPAANNCDACRDRLRRLYVSFGFRFHSETTVGPHTVVRFELAV